jgi:hypothetical protein
MVLQVLQKYRELGAGIAIALAAAVGFIALRSTVSTPAEAVQRPSNAQGKRDPVSRNRAAPQNRPAETDHPPVENQTLEGDRWADTEIIRALEECVELLAPRRLVVDVSKPIRAGDCGAAAPILVRQVAGVDLMPPTVVNCRIAATLHDWIETKLQANAREVVGSSISRIVTASGYACRQRIGTSNTGRSEHSFANAIDISAFITTDGRTIDVLSGWGPTGRDRRAQALSGERRNHAGGDARSLRDLEDDVTAPEAIFLRQIHASACGAFGTVLGPEANEAHRNHLHLDLAPRRRSAFCE